MEALRERFGKYHVLDKIAQGGMAEVYKVKTVGIAGFEKIQALKRILPSSAREGRFIRSFIDEARIAVELTHRNIVQVFDFGKADGELFLAMELIEGRDLRVAMAQAVTRDALCPIPVAAYIIGEVASGLDYAHRKTDGYGGGLGIVHCDVSPSNVMMSTDGYVKILDFGIARATFASALERRRLRGKPRYMAPEQTLGEPPTAASDVFALGIIAWELFTGLPLYRGPNIKAILEAVRTTDPPRADRLNPEVPPEIAKAIATALTRDPAGRGTSADMIAACMRTALPAGARGLAEWFARLDAATTSQPARAAQPVAQPPSGASISVPPQASPPSRPSALSLTASLADIAHPPSELGSGTPGFPVEMPSERTTAPAAIAFERGATGRGSVEKFGDRDPTSTVVQRFGDRDRTSTATATSNEQQWGHESTLAGVARLVDALPGQPADRPSRPVYELLQLVPGTAPSAMRFDDDATRQAQALSAALAVGAGHAGGETSFDELELEVDGPAAAPEPAAGPDPLVEDPIDDESRELAVGVVAERRRTVVVAGVLDGAPADVLRPIAKALGELAYQRGGVVVALDAESLIVAFGLEVAGEDDVAIAMGWALDAAAMTRDQGTEVGAGGPTLRVGARTGVAVASEAGAPRIPADASDEARALAREAAPDRPMFVGPAGRVTSGMFELREVAAPRRIARRSKVTEVVGTRSPEDAERASLERAGAFVGRTAQLAELDVWYQRAVAAGRRLTVLVTGAAGIGKSRLVTELIARRGAAPVPPRVIRTAANPASHHAPFALVIDLYQAGLGLPPARGRGARALLVRRLQHLMQEAGVPDERARAAATDVDRGMELRDGFGVGAPEIADMRPRIAAGFATFRSAASGPGPGQARPLLTVIEDIHYADGASLEVLRHSLAAPAQGAELLVLTARPDGPPPPAVDAVIALGDLAGPDLRALISDRLGDAATPLNVAAVIARGGGNPLFAEELAQAVRDAGSAADKVPATARDVIAARVDRLPQAGKHALRLAAVMGGRVRARLLEELVGAVTDSDASWLDELVAAGFLVRAGADDELAFARGLVRDVVYDALPLRAQREAHARLGRLLSSRFFAGRDEPPAVIAEHLERGGDPAGAAAFWLRAGKLALTASDAEAAIACFTRTLALERELGVVPPTPTSRARRREALAGRDDAHRLRGDIAADAGDLDELQRLCEGDAHRLADVALRRAQRLIGFGDYTGASVATVVAEDFALVAENPRQRGEALRLRGEVLERLGRFDEALVMVSAARELFAQEGAVADEMQAMVGRGRIHLMRAHYEQARDAYRPVIARIEKTGDPWLERIVQNHVAIIEMCLGNYPAAMTSAQRSLELCRRYGDRVREGEALSVAGIVLHHVGLYEPAAAMFGDALELFGRTASRWSRADCLIYAGACDARRGLPGGIAMIDEALAEARRLGARYLEANALITRAGANLRRGDLTGAVRDAGEGVAVAQQATLVGYEIQGLARQAARARQERRPDRRSGSARPPRARAARSATPPRELRGRGLRRMCRGPRASRRPRSQPRGQSPWPGRGRPQARDSRRASGSDLARDLRRPARGGRAGVMRRSRPMARHGSCASAFPELAPGPHEPSLRVLRRPPRSCSPSCRL